MMNDVTPGIKSYLDYVSHNKDFSAEEVCTKMKDLQDKKFKEWRRRTLFE